MRKIFKQGVVVNQSKSTNLIELAWGLSSRDGHLYLDNPTTGQTDLWKKLTNEIILSWRADAGNIELHECNELYLISKNVFRLLTEAESIQSSEIQRFCLTQEQINKCRSDLTALLTKTLNSYSGEILSPATILTFLERISLSLYYNDEDLIDNYLQNTSHQCTIFPVFLLLSWCERLQLLNSCLQTCKEIIVSNAVIEFIYTQHWWRECVVYKNSYQQTFEFNEIDTIVLQRLCSILYLIISIHEDKDYNQSAIKLINNLYLPRISYQPGSVEEAITELYYSFKVLENWKENLENDQIKFEVMDQNWKSTTQDLINTIDDIHISDSRGDKENIYLDIMNTRLEEIFVDKKNDNESNDSNSFKLNSSWNQNESASIIVKNKFISDKSPCLNDKNVISSQYKTSSKFNEKSHENIHIETRNNIDSQPFKDLALELGPKYNLPSLHEPYNNCPMLANKKYYPYISSLCENKITTGQLDGNIISLIILLINKLPQITTQILGKYIDGDKLYKTHIEVWAQAIKEVNLTVKKSKLDITQYLCYQKPTRISQCFLLDENIVLGTNNLYPETKLQFVPVRCRKTTKLPQSTDIITSKNIISSSSLDKKASPIKITTDWASAKFVLHDSLNNSIIHCSFIQYELISVINVANVNIEDFLTSKDSIVDIISLLIHIPNISIYNNGIIKNSLSKQLSLEKQEIILGKLKSIFCSSLSEVIDRIIELLLYCSEVDSIKLSSISLYNCSTEFGFELVQTLSRHLRIRSIDITPATSLQIDLVVTRSIKHGINCTSNIIKKVRETLNIDISKEILTNLERREIIKYENDKWVLL